MYKFCFSVFLPLRCLLQWIAMVAAMLSYSKHTRLRDMQQLIWVPILQQYVFVSSYVNVFSHKYCLLSLSNNRSGF